MSDLDIERSFLFKSFRLLQQFSSVSRYSRDRLICPENDLEHTGWVAMWSYFIATELRYRCHCEIDFSKLLRGAVVHDIDEALTGDVPRPTKYYSKTIHNAIKSLEKKSVKTVHAFLGHKDYFENLLADWEGAKGTKTIEQRIVKLADLMSVVYKVWLEVILLSNKSFIIVAEEVHSVIIDLLYEDYESCEEAKLFKEVLLDAKNILEECICSAEKVSHLVPKPLNIEK